MGKVKVIKRDGSKQDFDRNKIIIAIEKAMKSPQGTFVEGQAEDIAKEVEKLCTKDNNNEVDIKDIESSVIVQLANRDNLETAIAYEGFRAIQEYKRKVNTTDKLIESVINLTDKEIRDENSNKNPEILSTQRDLIAGEVSKDITKRRLLTPELLEAHESGVIHLHK